MSIVQNAPDTDQHALQTWCEEVAALHAEKAKPIELFIDPRVMELFRVDPRLLNHSSGPQDLADRYFEHCVPLPAWPLPAPAWAVETVIQMTFYPQVEVIHKGKTWETGDHSAHIEQYVTVYAETYDHGDGSIEAGTSSTGSPLVDFGGADMYEYDDAENLRTVLNNVVAPLALYEKVGA